MLLEPPRTHLLGRLLSVGHLSRRADLRLGATAAAGTLALFSAGDALLLGVLLAVAAAELSAAVVAILATLAVVIRWSDTSLEAIAGAQAVLGPAGLVAPIAAAASAWCSALALVLASPRNWSAVAFGLVAALVVSGPAAVTALNLGLRVVAAAAGVGLALLAGRQAPPALARPAALALAAAACVLAVLR